MTDAYDPVKSGAAAWRGTRGLLAHAASLETALAAAKERGEQDEAVLRAWRSAFGTTQLSHALADRDALAEKLRRVERWLAGRDAEQASMADFVNTHARECGTKEAKDHCWACIKGAIDEIVFAQREKNLVLTSQLRELGEQLEGAKKGAEQYYLNWQSELVGNELRIKQRDELQARLAALQQQVGEGRKDTPVAVLPIYDCNGSPMGDGDSFRYQIGSKYEQVLTIKNAIGGPRIYFSDGSSDTPLADFWYAISDSPQSELIARQTNQP